MTDTLTAILGEAARSLDHMNELYEQIVGFAVWALTETAHQTYPAAATMRFEEHCDDPEQAWWLHDCKVHDADGIQIGSIDLDEVDVFDLAYEAFQHCTYFATNDRVTVQPVSRHENHLVVNVAA